MGSSPTIYVNGEPRATRPFTSEEKTRLRVPLREDQVFLWILEPVSALADVTCDPAPSASEVWVRSTHPSGQVGNLRLVP